MTLRCLLNPWRFSRRNKSIDNTLPRFKRKVIRFRHWQTIIFVRYWSLHNGYLSLAPSTINPIWVPHSPLSSYISCFKIVIPAAPSKYCYILIAQMVVQPPLLSQGGSVKMGEDLCQSCVRPNLIFYLRF